MIQNPILRGFCPDPSIIRVGEDYYIATSTFEWWPGVKLFHSRDLKHWEQIPSPLRRESQLNMAGNPASGGVWAPCLSYDGQYYYLVYTDVKTKNGRYHNNHNYMVYTDDIYGEWSEPLYLNSIGFDPSLFHDNDGRKYLINMVNGFKGILVQELVSTGGKKKAGGECGSIPVSLRTPQWKLAGERKKVYNGSGLRCTEGPHMYHIGDWYYLITAEGGTGYQHCVTLARSKSVWGPFETAPENPVLTSNQENPAALQKCGHGDLVETPDGEWYLVHLCSRPIAGQKWCTLGRETGIQKVYWDKDGWLKLSAGGRFARLCVPEPGEEGSVADMETGSTVEACSTDGGTLDIRDEFDKTELPVYYSSLRVSYESFADLGARTGHLRLRGQESMNSLHHVSLIAVRQQEACARAQTCMEFAPDYPEQAAGLAYMYDAMNFYLLVKTADENGQSVLTLIKSDMGVITDEVEPLPVLRDEKTELRARTSADGSKVGFSFREPGGQWQSVKEGLTTQIVTDEYCRGFTGAHFGMYIHDMTGLGYHADFAYFEVQYGKRDQGGCICKECGHKKY